MSWSSYYYFFSSKEEEENSRIYTLPDGKYRGTIYSIGLIDQFRTFRMEMVLYREFCQKELFTYTCPIEKCLEKPVADLLIHHGNETNYSLERRYIDFTVKNIPDSNRIMHTEFTDLFIVPLLTEEEKQKLLAELDKGCIEILDDDDSDETESDG